MGKIVILISTGIPNKAASDFRKEYIEGVSEHGAT